MLRVDWDKFKSFVTARSLSVQYVDLGDKYWLIAIDSFFSLECILIKDYHSAETADFDTNFKANGNKKLSEPRDSDGSPLSRGKVTTSGWHYQLHSIEFSSSKKQIDYSKKVDGEDIGFTTMKAFKDNGSGGYTEITEDSELNLAIKTEFEWEPNHDYEILGAMFYQASIPTENIRMWTIGVPDIPGNMGGSKMFAQGGVNLKFIGAGEALRVDGRAPKYLTYSPIYHSNKLKLVFKHPAGLDHKMMIVFEIFRA